MSCRPWSLALVLLQVALLGLLLDRRWEGIVTAPDLLTVLRRPRLQSGGRLPPFRVLSNLGPVNIRATARETMTVIFSQCAECSRTDVLRWAEEGRRRGDRVVVVLDTSPNLLEGIRDQWHLSGECYATQGLRTFRCLGIERLPLMVRTDGTGLVLAALQGSQGQGAQMQTPGKGVDGSAI